MRSDSATTWPGIDRRHRIARRGWIAASRAMGAVASVLALFARGTQRLSGWLERRRAGVETVAAWSRYRAQPRRLVEVVVDSRPAPPPPPVDVVPPPGVPLRSNLAKLGRLPPPPRARRPTPPSELPELQNTIHGRGRKYSS
jgi:hypothetical protein